MPSKPIRQRARRDSVLHSQE